MLAGDGILARCDGLQPVVVRGRSTWTIPLAAPAAPRITPAGVIEVAIRRPRPDPRHGLGPGLALPAPNPYAADVFLDRLRRGIAAASPYPDGHSAIRYEVEEKRSPRRRTLVTTAAVLACLAALVAVAFVCPRPKGPPMSSTNR